MSTKNAYTGGVIQERFTKITEITERNRPEDRFLLSLSSASKGRRSRLRLVQRQDLYTVRSDVQIPRGEAFTFQHIFSLPQKKGFDRFVGVVQ
ncbi:hypothetical protein DFP97_11782 [Paenibacillus prosopidis]|uniref:Uncharacterized protein n=1 Tax=Paenibacillus prosopidis TaxID=630520 RepID=A0A368VLF8_9BACL|nr:hypothetical protein DFP97_11782 [Paenibacillus prosopidis]